MMGHPFPGLGPSALRRRIAVGATVAAVVGAAMLLLEPVLVDRGAGIVELELAGSGGARRILDDWGARGCDAGGYGCTTGDVVWRAKAIVLLDFAFLAGYGVGGAALLSLLADRRRDRRPVVARGFELLAWGVLAAAVFDALENTALWQVLVLETRGYAEAATAFAVAKFALLAGALLATPVLLVVGPTARVRSSTYG